MKTQRHYSTVIVDNPLFNMGRVHKKPKSAKDLQIVPINRNTFMPLNELWHSRLPNCKNAFEGFFFGAKYDDKNYAVAWWSKPVARSYNGKDYLELRRLAICQDAPKFTATRMLSQMRKHIKISHPHVVKLISYQDTEVHTGTIYKADNWTLESFGGEKGKGWTTRDANRINQSKAPKNRWGYDL